MILSNNLWIDYFLVGSKTKTKPLLSLLHFTIIATITAVGTGFPFRVPDAVTVALLNVLTTASFFVVLSTPKMLPASSTNIVKKWIDPFL
jgi:hypothetical protein